MKGFAPGRYPQKGDDRFKEKREGIRDLQGFSDATNKAERSRRDNQNKRLKLGGCMWIRIDLLGGNREIGY